MLVTSIFSFSHRAFYPIKSHLIFLSTNVFKLERSKILSFGQPFPKRQILESSKLTEFADDNFEFDKNG